MIHEYAHARVVKLFRPDATFEFIFYPHIHHSHFRWAGVYWNFNGPKLDWLEHSAILLAPRYASILGMFLSIMCLICFDNIIGNILTILFGGSFIEFFANSFGFNKHSDLKKLSKYTETSPWWWRSWCWLMLTLMFSIFVFCFLRVR